MPSPILDVIRHYQRSIEKSPNDEARLLHCLDKLYRFPVEVEHLQETGVGKTVNSLRKYEGEVGVAAKALVSKWKAMVAAEDSHINENYEQHHIESQQYHEREQDIHNDTSHNNQSNDYSDHDKNELGNTNSSSSSIRHSSHSSSRYKDIKSSSKESSNKSKHHDRKDDTRHKYNSEYEKYRRDGSKESDSKRLKFDEKSINACGSSSGKTSKQIEVYDNLAALPDDCGIDDADDDDDDEENNLVIDVIKDKRDDNEKGKSESHKKNSNDRHHKDNDINKSHRDSQIERKLEKEGRRNKDKRDLKKKSDLENERSEHKDKKFEKNLNRDRKHSKKDKKTEVEHNESDAHKSKSKSKHKDRQRGESKAKNESENVKKRKRDKSESPPTKPKMPKVVIDGIDSSMGTSFEEALGMIPIIATTSKTQIKVKSPKLNGSQTSSSHSTAPSTSASTSSSRTSDYLRLSKKSGTPPLLASTAKLEPLDPGIVLELPTISPNYKPMPLNPKVMECVFSNNKPQKRIMTDEEAFGAGISSKTIRTKVYSGTKSAASLQVPTLFDMCIRTLQKNIDALEYTGGVPFEVLRPVLERATPQQLLVFEDYNPYLMEDSDILWQQHCNRYYKCHKRLEMETWREMYLRCQEEQNEKLNMLAENIKQSQKQIALPLRKTQLAFVDEVKPPRNIMRKQEIFGTKAKPVATPAARVAALQNVSANIAKLGDTRLKVATGTRDTAQAVNSMRPRKAPLMQKTLQLMKGRFKR